MTRLLLALAFAPFAASLAVVPTPSQAVAAKAPLRVVEEWSHNHRELQTIGECFSPYVYNLILNQASMAASYGRQFYNSTSVDGEGRLELELGTRTTTIIVLAVIAGISVVLLLAGEWLLNTVLILVTIMASFMGFLYLFQWAFSSSVVPMEGFVKCILPFILTILAAIAASTIVYFANKKYNWIVFFVMGGAGGAFGMFMLRQFILAGNPSLAQEAKFNLYWIGLAAVSLIAGVVAVKLQRAIMICVTCLIGGYGFSVALCGFIPTFGGSYPANWVFFVIFGVAAAAGVAWQLLLAPKVCGSKDESKKNINGQQHQRGQQQRNVEVMMRP